jgi:phage-related protein
MPVIGPSCHELRIRDERRAWRILYRIDPDAIVIAAVFAKKTRQTPPDIIEASQRRLRRYDAAVHEGDGG